MVYTDTLYDKAFAFKKGKKWRKLNQNFMIAIETLHQGCWYAIPMHNENRKAGGFLLEGGQAGLKWILDLANEEYQKGLDEYERIVQDRYHEEYIITFTGQTQMVGWQDLDKVKDYCHRNKLAARGTNFYPTFRHMSPMEMSWILRTEEQGRFCETALAALLTMEEYLGEELQADDCMWQHMSQEDYRGTIPALVQQRDGSWKLSDKEIDGHYEPSWPTAVLNDLEIARLKRVKKNADVWQVDKFLYEEPVLPDGFMEKQSFSQMASEEPAFYPEEPAFYPEGVVLFNECQGDVLAMNNSRFNQEGYKNLADMLRDAFKRCGRPRRFVVCRQESYDFFKNVCQKLDIELEMTEELPELMSIRQDCIHRNSCPEDMDDLDDLDDWDDGEFDLDELMSSGGHFGAGRGKKTALQQGKFPENELFTKEMLVAFMGAFWQTEKPAKLTNTELVDMVNTCIMMPCTKEAMDFIFNEVRKRMETGEIIGLDVIPGKKSNHKKKR